MSLSLDEWQTRLEQHFETLTTNRAGSDFRVFALEHGLSGDEIAEISMQLCSRLKSGQRLYPHWLLWVIYSTEHGYQYTGDEYWPSFTSQTPGWDDSNKYQLARWFKKFQDSFNGVIPSGRWANHFSIISRPITHAILPKYLQYQFAKALYDSRFHLASLKTLDPAKVGRLLAQRANHASTRFQQFLQQEELTGRIVLALLGEQSVGTSDTIYLQTLERVVDDLEKVRNAREWLGDTRQQVGDRFTGIGRGLPGHGNPLFDPETNAPELLQLDVKPKVYLSHRGAGKWIAWMDVPSFKDMAMLDAEFRSFLQRTRCRLNGSDDVKPAGWLLSGSRKGVLKQWPNPGEPLIRFERPHAQIENILQMECRFSTGPNWLFRVGRDGTAREIRGGIVRPGGKYVILSEAPIESRFRMRSLEAVCDGVAAYRLDVPADVTSELTAWLESLDLHVARTIRVWPAGFPGRGWDGEGYTEWLTTEAPCFGLSHDHPLDGYVLCLNSDTEFEIVAGEIGHPVFFQISRLPAGKHILTVKAKRSSYLNAVVSTPEAEGYIELHVREPEPWVPGVTSHSGLIATLDPYDADLDRVWRNEVDLSVLGPEYRSVSVKVRLMDRQGNEVLYERVGNDMGLPVQPKDWRVRFGQFLKRDQISWVYLEAATGEFIISGAELGQMIFRFEHEIPPLRWVLSRKKENIWARLVDDTGIEDSQLEVLFFSMETPVVEKRLSPDKMQSGLSIDRPGGLLYAKHGDHEDFVVVSCGHTAKDFKGLVVTSDYSYFDKNRIKLSKVLQLHANWHNARLYGPLVDVRWNAVTNKLLALILERLCGEKWTRAEKKFQKSSHSEQALDTLLRLVERKSTGFSTMLSRESGQWSSTSNDFTSWYQELAARYHVCTDPMVSAFAVKLVREAYGVPKYFGKETDRLLDALRDCPAVLRGVRFLECVSKFPRKQHSSHGVADL